MIELSEGIRLLSGAMFDYNRPHEGVVAIEDIASALSKVCRFAGHVNEFYSVAQHAVNASWIVPPEHAFTALMHDTAEAFTNDIPTPLKVAIPAFRELETIIESAMAERFGFEYPLPPEVKLADLQMLALEKHSLKDDHLPWAVLYGIEWLHLRKSVELTGWEPEYAEFRFLRRFEELSGQRARPEVLETGGQS